jgi:serine/threonine protein kinase
MALADRYDAVQQIGAGVSATVYRAVERATNSVVAIKLLNPHLRTDPISLERFRREVQITRLLEHPQIVPIYDLVIDGEETYLVMEYVEGFDLKTFIRLYAPIPIATVVSILRQILQILSLCHARNVVHRDLKSQNIMIARDGADSPRGASGETPPADPGSSPPTMTLFPGQVRLLDFGISRMTALSDLTQTGTSLGSPEYMAPELFAANTYDPRTDIYALGVIAFELVAGTLPFQGDALAVLCRQHLQMPVPVLRQLRADVPEWLQDVIERMLAKKGYERYQSADEVLADIARQRVIARELPSLPKRECVICRAAVIAELPVCTFCGYNTFETVMPGTCELHRSDDEDLDKLARYFHSVFGVRWPQAAASGTLLLSGIDRFSAEAIKKSALAHGLYLTIREQSRGHALQRLGSTLLAVPTVGCFVLMVFAVVVNPFDAIERALSFWTGPMRWDWVDGPEVLAVSWIATLGLASWGAVTLFRRQHQKPVFANPAVLTAQARHDAGWLTELLPFFKADASAALKRLVAQMVEKYVLLMRFGNHAVVDVRSTLERILVGAAGVAEIMAEVETHLDETHLAQLSATLDALRQRRRRERDPERAAALGVDADTLAEEIRQLTGLEERYSALTNKLVHLQSVFNTLLGRVVVLRGAVDAVETEMLQRCTEALDGDLRLSRALHAELERAA